MIFNHLLSPLSLSLSKARAPWHVRLHMGFHTYILRCVDDSYYVGHTDDLERRLAQHDAGTLGGYTARRRPVTLLWAQSFHTRDDAFAAERQLKGWSRAKKEAMMAGDWQLVSILARGGKVGGPSAGPSTGSG